MINDEQYLEFVDKMSCINKNYKIRDHAYIGIFKELGEFFSLVCKNKFYGVEVKDEQFLDELSDVYWFVYEYIRYLKYKNCSINYVFTEIYGGLYFYDKSFCDGNGLKEELEYGNLFNEVLDLNDIFIYIFVNLSYLVTYHNKLLCLLDKIADYFGKTRYDVLQINYDKLMKRHSNGKEYGKDK